VATYLSFPRPSLQAYGDHDSPTGPSISGKSVARPGGGGGARPTPELYYSRILNDQVGRYVGDLPSTTRSILAVTSPLNLSSLPDTEPRLL
jgi:hypothetical protein